ncbi:S8 family serine peptidase, partial [Rhizobium johnstonii]|uniref:S8 family serine peptidase n=1 Tax=Rhizobium johnstonii TaxID=3019933 RepID=UPI003F968C9A
RILKRDHEDYRDSGAIMVAAGSSTVPHERLDFSNYGSRIDCFGWGEGIDTTGGSGTGTGDYTTGFSGTSGASPIVAGAALLLQRWWR